VRRERDSEHQLHEHQVEPAVEPARHLGQTTDALEPQLLVQAQRGPIIGVDARWRSSVVGTSLKTRVEVAITSL